MWEVWVHIRDKSVRYSVKEISPEYYAVISLDNIPVGIFDKASWEENYRKETS